MLMRPLRLFGLSFRLADATLGGVQGMAHIHDKIDFTVAIFVVHDAKILLIHHRKLDKWLPLGGHIELDEEPEQAALREAKEESGLEVELLGERAPTTEPADVPTPRSAQAMPPPTCVRPLTGFASQFSTC